MNRLSKVVPVIVSGREVMQVVEEVRLREAKPHAETPSTLVILPFSVCHALWAPAAVMAGPQTSNGLRPRLRHMTPVSNHTSTLSLVQSMARQALAAPACSIPFLSHSDDGVDLGECRSQARAAYSGNCHASWTHSCTHLSARMPEGMFIQSRARAYADSVVPTAAAPTPKLCDRRQQKLATG